MLTNKKCNIFFVWTAYSTKAKYIILHQNATK